MANNNSFGLLGLSTGIPNLPTPATTPIPPTPSLVSTTITPLASQGSSQGSVQLAAPPLPGPVISPGPELYGSNEHITPERAASQTLKHFSLPGRLLDPADQHRTLTRFTCFDRLPAELRIKIWKFGIPNRILTIFYSYKIEERCAIRRKLAIAQTPRTLSSVCHESNEATAKCYRKFKLPCMGWTLTFAPAADTLYFKSSEVFGEIPRPGFSFGGSNFKCIKQICIDIGKEEVKRDGIVKQEINLPPSIMVDFQMGLDLNLESEISDFKEVLIVVGHTGMETRIKVLDPDVPIAGGPWCGNGTPSMLDNRASQLNALVKDLRQQVETNNGATVPVVKLVLLCKEEAGVPVAGTFSQFAGGMAVNIGKHFSALRS